MLSPPPFLPSVTMLFFFGVLLREAGLMMMLRLFLLYCLKKENQTRPSPAASLSLSPTFSCSPDTTFQLYNRTWLMAVINGVMKHLFLFIVQCPQAAGLPNGSNVCVLAPHPAMSLYKE